MRNITLISSIIGFIIAFPLIYHFSYIGAAIVLSFSNTILGMLSMIYSIKKKIILYAKTTYSQHIKA